MQADDTGTTRAEPADPGGGGSTAPSPPSRTSAAAREPAKAPATAGQNFRRRPASLGDAFRFFLPLMLMAELMMISHAVISAFLARMSDPEPILAAYSISFYFHATLGSPIWACQFVAVSFIKDRASMKRLLFFSLQVAAAITLILFTVGLTPAGDWLFRTLFGAGPEVADAAQRCTVIFSFVMLFAVLRSLVYGLFMVERKTLYVTLGTVVRLAGLFVVLAGLTLFVEGAEVGALALVACIAIETLFGLVVVRPFFRRLPPGTHPPSYRELWKFSWPIMIMQTAESGVIFTINLFLGRLPRPELALAAFGLLDSVMRVILSPLRNVIQTVQTLVRFRRDVGVIVTFAVIVGGGFAAVMLLFHLEPVRTWALEGIMGLPPHMAEYVAPALGFGFVLALAMAAASLSRGLLIAAKRTGAIAIASAVRLVTVGAVGGVAIALGTSNGALIGIYALIGAFLAESAVLLARLLWIDRTIGPRRRRRRPPPGTSAPEGA